MTDRDLAEYIVKALNEACHLGSSSWYLYDDDTAREAPDNRTNVVVVYLTNSISLLKECIIDPSNAYTYSSNQVPLTVKKITVKYFLENGI